MAFVYGITRSEDTSWHGHVITSQMFSYNTYFSYKMYWAHIRTANR